MLCPVADLSKVVGLAGVKPAADVAAANQYSKIQSARQFPSFLSAKKESLVGGRFGGRFGGQSGPRDIKRGTKMA